MRKLIIYLLLLIIPLTFAYSNGRDWHMMDWGHMYFGYGGVIMWIILLVLIGVVIYFVLNRQKLIKREDEETPFEILKKRYAKGEITKQEYDRMKKDLE